jgi:hypothetical protein
MRNLYEEDEDEGSVACLEPAGPGWHFGLPKMPRNINPALSFEHAEAAGDRIYWVVRFKRARNPTNEIKGLSSLPALARGFGLDATPWRSA